LFDTSFHQQQQQPQQLLHSISNIIIVNIWYCREIHNEEDDSSQLLLEPDPISMTAAEALLELRNQIHNEEDDSSQLLLEPDPIPMTAPEALLELGNQLPRRASDDKGCTATPTLIDEGRTSVYDLLKGDKHLRAFTGIPNTTRFKQLLHVIALLEGKERKNPERCLSCRDRLLLCLMKLKLNLSFVCLSALFNVSSFSCTRFFRDMIMKLARVLEFAIPFPTKEEIQKNLPICFKNFKTTRIILDCTEVKIEKSKCLKCRISTYSHYKGGNTMKVLLGVAPSGLITYVGPFFGGRSSDKALFLASGLLNKLEPKESVMVDKGFFIEEECLMKGINLIRPPFKDGNLQMTPKDAYTTVAVAAARVHVERRIQRMKVFKILKNEFPFRLLPYSDNIITVIAGIVNLGTPILSLNKFLK